MRLLPPALVLLASLPAASAARPLDLVLRADAPRALAPGFAPPFQVEVKFTVENPGGPSGLVSFSGRCAWEDPRRPLIQRWKSALVLEETGQDRGRVLGAVTYRIKDRAGRTVLTFLGRAPAQRLHTGGLSALVLHLITGTLGEPGGAVEHRVESEF